MLPVILSSLYSLQYQSLFVNEHRIKLICLLCEKYVLNVCCLDMNKGKKITASIVIANVLNHWKLLIFLCLMMLRFVLYL